MSKAAITSIVVAVIILGVGGALLANHKSSDSTTKSNGSTSSQSSSNEMKMKSSSSSASSVSSSTNSVTIENFAFSPENITVKKGTTVTWTNKDSATHTVTEFDSQTGPKSGDLATGKSYSFTFDTVGTFKYDCSIHPNMTGVVTVTE